MKASRPAPARDRNRRGPRRAADSGAASRARALARTLHERLAAYEKAAARLGDEPDDEASVHDFRVASRRLVGTLQMADASLGASTTSTSTRSLRRKIKNRFSKLGPLRDLDVEGGLAKDLESDHPVIAAFRKKLAKRARRARLLASKLAASKSLTRVVEETARAAAHLEPRLAKEPAAHVNQALVSYLQRRQRQSVAHVAHLRPHTEATFHDLRIGLKKVRYAAEVMASLQGARDGAHSATTSWESLGNRCKEFQDRLGHIQDLAVLETDLRDFARRHPDKATKTHAAARAVAARRHAEMQAFFQRHDEVQSLLADFGAQAATLVQDRTPAPVESRRGPRARPPHEARAAEPRASV
jgi:CHAD domain-containing protein